MYRSKEEIRKSNKKLYSKAPTIEQIMQVKEALGLSENKLEVLFSIPAGTIKRIKWSGRTLNALYWNRFYLILKKLPK